MAGTETVIHYGGLQPHFQWQPLIIWLSTPESDGAGNNMDTDGMLKI